MSDKDKKIFIWGLKGVGKTTFINAFHRELSIVPDTSLSFELKTDELPEMKPTEDSREWLFKVSSLAGGAPDEYSLGLYDDKGEAMEYALMDTENKSIILYYLKKSAKGVIALLEPELILNNVEYRRKLVRLIQNLLDVLNQRSDHPCLALCMNKMDLIDARWKNPEVFFHICFGESWKKITASISSSKNVDVMLFLTSAAGYISDGRNQELSNFSNNNIAVEDAWKPWNVSVPFLWIFSHFETSQPKPWWSFPLRGNDRGRRLFHLSPFF